MDAIQSSQFITEKKSNTLIKKLERLVSKYDAQKLQRQVYVSGRIKTMNESIYYVVDTIHNAISENKKIQFQEYKKRNGASPRWCVEKIIGIKEAENFDDNQVEDSICSKVG